MNKKRGFTLVEVITAVAILAIIMIMFASLFNNSLILSGNSQQIDENSSVAQSLLEENGGTYVEDKDLTFTFGTNSVLGNGRVVETISDEVDYSAIVPGDVDSDLNKSGWGTEWVNP